MQDDYKALSNRKRFYLRAIEHGIFLAEISKNTLFCMAPCVIIIFRRKPSRLLNESKVFLEKKSHVVQTAINHQENHILLILLIKKN
ncbi:MAG: hypothetical protein ACTSVI_04555 [Promethearchaeota archaeon]